MTQWVHLVPDESIGANLGSEPLVVCHCRQLVIRSNEKTSWKAELVKWHGGRDSSTIHFHVLDDSVVVAQPVFSVLNALSVVDEVPIAVASWEVFQEDIVSIHIVDFSIGIGDVTD